MGGNHGEHDPKCPNCGKVVTDWELACWHCEEDLDKTQNKAQKPECFIATAVYGEHAWQTQLLRDFRDDFLQVRLFGRIFIAVYYFVSPFIARVVRESKGLQVIARKQLDWIIDKIQQKKKHLKK